MEDKRDNSNQGDVYMTDATRRKELKANYRQSPPEAGVYRLLNTYTGRFYLASTTDLASIRSKIEFARSTGSPGVFDYKMRPDLAKTGIAAISLEILETVSPDSTTTPEELKKDLSTLVELWREKLGTEFAY